MDVKANLNKFNKILFDFCLGKEHVVFQTTFDCTVFKKFTDIRRIIFQQPTVKRIVLWTLNVIEVEVYSKVNNRSTRTRCEICSKLTIKIPE